MAYPQRLLTEDEVVLHDFRPHWKMLAPAILAAAVAGAAIFGAWAVPPASRSADRIATLVIALGAGGYIASVALRWWFTQYVLTSERLIVRQGVLSRSGLEIPLEQINNVSFSQTIGERLLRFGDLVIESAGSTGRSQIDNIPDPQAFQSEIYRSRDVRVSERQGGGGAALSVVEQLERLEALRDRGTLTPEEFEAEKRELLDGG